MRTQYRVISGGLRRKVAITRNAREAVRLMNHWYGTLYVERGLARSYPIAQLTRVAKARDYLRTLEARRARGEIE